MGPVCSITLAHSLTHIPPLSLTHIHTCKAGVASQCLGAHGGNTLVASTASARTLTHKDRWKMGNGEGGEGHHPSDSPSKLNTWMARQFRKDMVLLKAWNHWLSADPELPPMYSHSLAALSHCKWQGRGERGRCGGVGGEALECRVQARAHEWE